MESGVHSLTHLVLGEVQDCDYNRWMRNSFAAKARNPADDSAFRNMGENGSSPLQYAKGRLER